MSLTPKQELFVREYLVDLNATQAAIRAGYSPNGATVTGSKLLANPKVQALVDQAKGKRAKKLELTADGVLRNIQRLTRKAAKVGELGVAMKGLELQGKHLKLFVDRVETSGSVSIRVVNPYAEDKDE